MKHALIGSLAIALVAVLALPAVAQQDTQSPQSSPGSSQGSEQQPVSDQSRVGSDVSTDKAHSTIQTDTAAKAHESDKPSKVQMRISHMITGGEEADKLQFQALDQHLQMLENSITQLRQLSNQPEQNAAEILRWSNIRDQHAHGVSDVVASYFLEQRLLPPSMPELGISSASMSETAREEAGIAGAQPTPSTTAATPSTTAPAERGESRTDPMRQAYLDQLQTAHELLVRSNIIKQTSDPAEVREMRSLVTKLRSNQQQYQRQMEAQVRELDSRDATEQAARSGETATEPGIDQPGERSAARPNEDGSSSVSPDSSTVSPNTGGSTSNQGISPSSPSTPGTSGGQGSTPGTTTP